MCQSRSKRDFLVTLRASWTSSPLGSSDRTCSLHTTVQKFSLGQGASRRVRYVGPLTGQGWGTLRCQSEISLTRVLRDVHGCPSLYPISVTPSFGFRGVGDLSGAEDGVETRDLICDRPEVGPPEPRDLREPHG